MNPQHYLDQGAKFPFDATDIESDDGNLPPAKDWAHAAARGVIMCLSERDGIDDALHDQRDATRIEIVETLAAIIRAAAETKGE